MKKKKRRLVSLLLTAAMLLTLLPVGAFAAEDTGGSGVTSAVQELPAEGSDPGAVPAGTPEEAGDAPAAPQTAEADGTEVPAAPEEAPSQDPPEEPGEEPAPDEQTQGSPERIRTLAEVQPKQTGAEDDGDALGEFRLTIHHTIPDGDSGFTAALTPEGGGEAIPVKMKEDGKANSSGFYAGIAPGKYTLQVTGTHYVPYTQSLTFKNDCVSVTLYNDDLVNEGRKEGSLFGVITLGDFDGDGTIDDDDANALKERIGSTAGADLMYDMNGDKVLDITDLAYVVRNQSGNVEAKSVSTASSLALKKAVQATIQATTQVKTAEGETSSATVVETILSGAADTYVAFTPKKDGDISEENPIAIELNVGGTAGPDPEQPEI